MTSGGGLQPFEYHEQLDETHFRLLVLRAGAPADTLRCTLEVRPLPPHKDVPEYTALSYACGPDPSDHKVECHGKVMLIRPTLYAALKSIQRLDEDLLLWCDQICINQHCIEERSAQVNVMNHIFANSALVTSWLGPDEQGEAPMLEQLVEALAAVTGSWITEKTATVFPPDDELQAVGLPVRESPCWTALNNCLRLPYFSRMWVVQEVLLASSAIAIWGSVQIGWRKIRKLFHLCIVAGLIDNPSEVVNKAQQFLFLERQPLTLIQLLQLTDSLESSDERDKIFSLLGIMETLKGDARSVKADYSKSMIQIRCETTRYIVEQAKNLQIFSHVQHLGSASLKTNGSWALMVRLAYPRLHPKPLVLMADLSATRDSVPYLGETERTLSCSVKGLHLGFIADYAAQFENETDFEAICSSWKLIRKPDDMGQKHLAIRNFIWTLTAGQQLDTRGYPSRADDYLLLSFAKHVVRPFLLETSEEEIQGSSRQRLHILVELLTQAVLSYRQAQPDPPGMKALIAEGTTWLKAKASAYFNHPTKEKDIFIDACLYAIRTPLPEEGIHYAFPAIAFQTLPGRRMFLTGDGKLGLGPPAMQKGDVLCVLFGGPTPYVLRPAETPGEYWFVGECYVEEWMDGQAMDLMDNGKLTPEWFLLR